MFAHSGHNSDRPCGHSSLICAVDAQIAVKRDASEKIVATLELSKNGEAGAEIVSRLVPVEVGKDEDGEPIRSCIIVAVDAFFHRRRRPGCQDTKSRTDYVVLQRLRRDRDRHGGARRGSRRNSLRNTLCDLRDGCAAASECTLDGGP